MKIEMNLISDKGKKIPIGELDMEIVFQEDVLKPPLVELLGEMREMSEITALIRGVKIVGNYQNVRKKPILIAGTHIDMDHTLSTSKLLYPGDTMQIGITLNIPDEETMTEEQNTIFFIENGESYSEWSVYGAVIGVEKDRDTIGAIIKYAIMESSIKRKEWDEIRDAYQDDRPLAKWSEIEAAIGRKPTLEDSFQSKFKEHGFTFVPYNGDFEAL